MDVQNLCQKKTLHEKYEKPQDETYTVYVTGPKDVITSFNNIQLGQ